MITQRRSKRKETGGRYRESRKKRLCDAGSSPALTKIGKKSVKAARGRSCVMRQRVLVAETANILDKKTGKYAQAKIKTVIDAPANRHYIRRNILVKGAVIDTEIGKAKITNKPGQDGMINAVLV